MEEVEIQVEVNPTEDINKVRQAVENIFSDLSFKEKQQHTCNLLIAHGEGSETLAKFSHLLRRERIRNAARAVLRQGLRGNVITFFLNKQVAYAGHISFCEPIAESSLGPIKVRIKSGDPRKLIEWLAPKTM
ncbi:hypothetical protein KAT42_02235 [Candidatus Bathyarchaeota archaeon]|nr:hypothetical protein [Candidatus Bathyarchaeota archaeon]